MQKIPGFQRPVQKVHNLTTSQARYMPFKPTLVTCTGSILIQLSDLRQDFLNGYLCLSFGITVYYTLLILPYFYVSCPSLETYFISTQA
jgi:hypothetical protein